MLQCIVVQLITLSPIKEKKRSSCLSTDTSVYTILDQYYWCIVVEVSTSTFHQKPDRIKLQPLDVIAERLHYRRAFFEIRTTCFWTLLKKLIKAVKNFCTFRGCVRLSVQLSGNSTVEFPSRSSSLEDSRVENDALKFLNFRRASPMRKQTANKWQFQIENFNESLSCQLNLNEIHSHQASCGWPNVYHSTHLRISFLHFLANFPTLFSR